MTFSAPGVPAEHRGRLVRETWVTWAKEQPDPKPSWLTGWDDLDDGQREVDMRIGAAVAAAERERCIKIAKKAAAGLRASGSHPSRTAAADALEILADALRQEQP